MVDRAMPDRPDIRIVHADERLVVIDKPHAMLSVPGKGPEKADCAAARVRARFPLASGPLVVHRLDMDTSGLMVFGLDAQAQRDLSLQFERRTVDKRYTALVDGQLREDQGVVTAPIRLDVDNRPVQIHDPERGRPSETRWRVLAREVDRTRVEFTPVTGRTHQLRVHAALPTPLGMGAPILGDALYGDPSSADRLMLHASLLRISHPDTGERLELRSDAPF